VALLLLFWLLLTRIKPQNAVASSITGIFFIRSQTCVDSYYGYFDSDIQLLFVNKNHFRSYLACLFVCLFAQEDNIQSVTRII